jgi:hypothetical protein
MSLSPADGAAYWLRWQVFVCGALIALPAAAAAALLPRLRRAAPPLRATDLWVPCWARLHPGWLLGYRAFALAAAVALLARLLIGHGLTVFYFYTQYGSFIKSSSFFRGLIAKDRIVVLYTQFLQSYLRCVFIISIECDSSLCK